MSKSKKKNDLPAIARAKASAQSSDGLFRVRLDDDDPVSTLMTMPDECLPSFMEETNGGASWEKVPGFNVFQARNAGLPDFAGERRSRGPRAENTIGDDDRTPIPDTTAIPWRSICRLDIEYQTGAVALGTGWFVGPRAIATAAHNLFHPDTGSATRISAWPAYDGVVHYNPPQIDEIIMPDAWAQSFALEDDYGVILLKSASLGARLGWFGIANYRDPPANLAAQVCGYAEDTRLPTQYFNGGRIYNWDKNFIYYTFDTERGMSGAPVFVNIEGKRYVIGIHTYGDPSVNRGRRVTGPVYKMLQDANRYR
jgi:V8-like Glu-specific endopeptidase